MVFNPEDSFMLKSMEKIFGETNSDEVIQYFSRVSYVDVKNVESMTQILDEPKSEHIVFEETKEDILNTWRYNYYCRDDLTVLYNPICQDKGPEELSQSIFDECFTLDVYLTVMD